ncbi:MAG: alpha/beta hydrolase [Chloroflexota bacterium]|nr:alpha/beta hydrolase [Chloroflexota bacterium]
MDIQRARADDGFELAYTDYGDGPPLLLLHGFGNDQMMWHTSGWVEDLQSKYRVITMDLRGCGASSASAAPTDYSLDLHLADIDTVLNVCGIGDTYVWGWSFGGTLGLHLAAHSPRITRAIIAGTYFGHIFTETYVRQRLDDVAPWVQAAATNTVEELELPPSGKAYVRRMNWPAYVARWHSLVQWPWVEPQDVRCPMLVYTGTKDGNIVVQLQHQRAAIKAAGIQLHILEGLAHGQLFTERLVIAPVVLPFLATTP